MTALRNRLLNGSLFWLSGAVRSPDDGAGAGTGETSPPAAAGDGNAVAGKGETTGFAAETEADDSTSMFAMPSDEALFSLEDEGEPSPTPAKPAAGTPAAEAGKETAPPVTPPAAVPSAPAAAPVVPPSPAPAAAAPAATPPVQPQAEAPAVATPQPGPADLLNLLDQGRASILPQLKAMYAISDADAEAIGIVDKGPLEQLAANLHFGVMRASVQMMLQTLPPLVNNMLTMRTREEEATSAFYAANPELSRGTDHEIVTRYANMFWQQFPQGTMADFTKQVGMMAKAHLGKLTAQTAAPTTPPAPGVTPKPVPPKQQKPSFTPASGSGAAPAAAAAPVPGGVDWAKLAAQMMNSDED